MSFVDFQFQAEMNESADFFRNEFDYQTDFTKFLEEAREHSFQVNSDAAQVEEKQLNWEKKSRKPWKTYLFSWLKNDKKSKSVKQHSDSKTLAPKARPVHVSGPIKRALGCTTARAQRAVSGPLTGLFGSEEDEVPYIYLGKQRVTLMDLFIW